MVPICQQLLKDQLCFYRAQGLKKVHWETKNESLQNATGYNRTQSKYYNYVYIHFIIYDDFNSPN